MTLPAAAVPALPRAELPSCCLHAVQRQLLALALHQDECCSLCRASPDDPTRDPCWSPPHPLTRRQSLGRAEIQKSSTAPTSPATSGNSHRFQPLLSPEPCTQNKQKKNRKNPRWNPLTHGYIHGVHLKSYSQKGRVRGRKVDNISLEVVEVWLLMGDSGRSENNKQKSMMAGKHDRGDPRV